MSGEINRSIQRKGCLGQEWGSHAFRLDPVFIPDRETKTYAEFRFPDKAKYSQSAKTWDLLVRALKVT
jgi:inosine/xanthosine triphosphate pyrophosphatase family protein